MSKDEAIGIESTVVERMRNLRYQVEMTGGHRILLMQGRIVYWLTR